FVHDLALQDPRAPLPRYLQDQRPYFQQLVTDFARQNELIRATVLRHDGALLLTSSGPALAVDDLLRQLESSPRKTGVILSPIRQISGDQRIIVVDAIIPVPQAQSNDLATDGPPAALILTLPISGILKDILSSESVTADREYITIVQQRVTVVEKVKIAGDRLELEVAESRQDVQPGMPLAFDRRTEGTSVYSLGAPVAGIPWTLHHAIDARAVLAPVDAFIKASAAAAVFATLLLTATFAAFWWRQGQNHHRQVADLYRSHAARVAHQHQFLTSITTSISDWLIVSDADGSLIYANPSFKAVAEGSPTSVMGRRWEDLVRGPSASETLDGDLLNLMNPDAFEMVHVGGDRRVISERMSDLRHADGSVAGTVRIVRDHTDLATERRNRLRALTQTIDAFVHAIELRDPFLLGHTHRLRSTAIAVGRRLRLEDDQLSNLAIAASLSQIGKIFVPDDILAKPDRHNAEEESIMRDHILHAVDILERLDLDRPIVDTLAQMHERLDGSGYPKGLSGEQIRLSSRILAVADVFCARTAPRSYRDRQSAGKTLYHLARNESRYDVHVVAALADIVGRGSKLDQADMIAHQLVDAAVWRERLRDLAEPVEAAQMS
ncbi:MAG: HD domain-containing phosphohydrolase, partial [Pseudomonadota bacterium]